MYKSVLLFVLSLASFPLHGAFLGTPSRNPITFGVLGGAAAGAGCGFFARWLQIPGSQTITGIANYVLVGALGGSLYGASLLPVINGKSSQKRGMSSKKALKSKMDGDTPMCAAQFFVVGLLYGIVAERQVLEPEIKESRIIKHQLTEFRTDMYFIFRLVDSLNGQITQLNGQIATIKFGEETIRISEIRNGKYPFGKLMQDLASGYNETVKNNKNMYPNNQL